VWKNPRKTMECEEQTAPVMQKKGSERKILLELDP
jgi:hypothetical protein